MATSDERREVAESLRYSAEQSCYAGVFDQEVLSILGVGMGKEDGLSDANDVRRLADLIDPTCRMEPEGEGFRCSACGTYHDMSGFDEFPWPRCPECGSRVKGSNSMPLGGEGR